MNKSKVRGKSLGELEVLIFIRSLYQGEVLSGYKHPEVKKELDIYLPEVGIGFEYNGSYWHSDKFLQPKAHLEKQRAYQQVGIQVYFLDESDWLNSTKRPILQARIKHLLGKIDKKIYARQTKVVTPTVLQEKEFLNQNHLQGYAISSYRIGLEHEGKLVAILTCVKPRTTTNSAHHSHTMELLRYSTSIDSTVVGGFSKLLKVVRQDLPRLYTGVTTLVTYCDKGLSTGNLYARGGFQFLREADPSYYYVLKGMKYNRYSFRKSVLEKKFPEYYKEDLSEREILNEVPNLHRVWNVGNYVYELNLLEPVQPMEVKDSQRKFLPDKVSFQEHLESLVGHTLPEGSSLDTLLEQEDGSQLTVQQELLSLYMGDSYQENLNALFQRKLDEKFGEGVYELLGNYFNVDTLVTIRHRESEVKKAIYPKSITTNGYVQVTDIFKKLSEKYKGRFKPVMETYVSPDTPMDFLDRENDNQILKVSPRGLYRRKTVPRAPTKIESFKAKVKEIFGDEYEVRATDLPHMNSPITIYSKSLDEARLITPHDFLSNKGFKKSRVAKGAENFDELLATYGFERLSAYKGLQESVRVKNSKTGETLTATANAIKLKLKRKGR